MSKKSINGKKKQVTNDIIQKQRSLLEPVNNGNVKNSSLSKEDKPFHNYKFPVIQQGPKAPYHSIRHDPLHPSGGIINEIENFREREHEQAVVEAMNRHEIGPRKLEAEKLIDNRENKLIDDYIKHQDMNRKEKNKFLRLFELGIYYTDKGKIRFDNKKYQELLHLYHSNTDFDKEVERKAMKAYDKYAKKAFGSEFGHDTPAEKRVAKDPNLRNLHDYPKMAYMKQKFLDKYKKKYAKKRMRYIKKEFKKRYRFNKWKNKYGFSL